MRREMTVAFAALALGGTAALAAAGRQRVAIEGAEVSGTTTPAAAALASVVLAGVAALIFLGSRGRRWLAALLALAGAGITIAMLRLDAFDAQWFTYGDSADAGPAVRSVWAWVGAGAGLLVAITAIWTAVRAPRWPPPKQRATLDQPPDVGGGGTAAARRSGSSWDALDRGEDPTA